MNVKNRFRPSLENLEGRELMTTGLGSLLPKAPLVTGLMQRQFEQRMTVDLRTDAAAQSDNQRTLSRSETSTRSLVGFESVLTIVNRTSAVVHYQFRWTRTGAWTNYSLRPGYQRTHYIGQGFGPRSPQIRFDYSYAPGYQARIYSLSYASVIDGPGLPPSGAGPDFTFRRVSNGINLYKTS